MKIDLESLHSPAEVNSFIIEMDNLIGELCNYGEELNILNDAQKTFYLNQNLEREVNNGGFAQYFGNSSGNFAHETIESLKTIEANKTANILQQAIDQFPDSRIPNNQEERNSILQIVEETASPFWEELEQKFYLYEDNLNELNLTFIKINRKDFQIE